MFKPTIMFAGTCVAVFAAFFCASVRAEASTASVRNSVSVSAETGGGTGDGATGRAEARASVRTEVNGEVIEQFEEVRSSDEGEPVRINHESFYESPVQAEVQVGTDVEVAAGNEAAVEIEAEAEADVLSEPAPVKSPGASFPLFTLIAVAGVALSAAAVWIIKLFLA